MFLLCSFGEFVYNIIYITSILHIHTIYIYTSFIICTTGRVPHVYRGSWAGAARRVVRTTAKRRPTGIARRTQSANVRVSRARVPVYVCSRSGVCVRACARMCACF